MIRRAGSRETSNIFFFTLFDGKVMFKLIPARKRQFLYLLILIFLPCSYSSGKLSIHLVDYRNAGSRTYDGGCCDNIRYCVSSCDNYFVLCLAGVGVTDKCSLYRRVTQVTSSDSISFSTSLGNGLRNPVIHDFTAWQPLKFSVEVWDDDSSNIIGRDSDLIDRYTLNIQHSPSPNKRDAPEYRHRLTGRRSTMNIKVKVYCDNFYFATNCSTFCKSRDDSSGHYTCDYTRGRKVCREGWYGKDCLVYCRSRNDSIGHYMCDEMGQKLCLDGWMGGNCSYENSSNIQPSSANSASIGSFYLSSASDSTIPIKVSTSSFSSFSSSLFYTSHNQFFTEIRTSFHNPSKSRNFYSSPISSDFSPILQASSATSSDNGPRLPTSSVSSDNGPRLPTSSVSSSDNGPRLPASSASSVNSPILSASSLSSSDNGPILPAPSVSSSDNSPILSALSVSSYDNGPRLSASSDNGPILPVSSVSSSDNGPILPALSASSASSASSDNGPMLPVSSVSSSDNCPILPASSVSSSYNGPILPASSVSSSDNSPILPALSVSSSDNSPILPALSVSSSDNGSVWPTLPFDINRTFSPTTTVYSSHSTSTVYFWFISSSHSTKATPPLGSTISYSHLQAKVSSTIVTSEIKVSIPVDKAVSAVMSKESDCRPAPIDNGSLKLIPVFMEIEISKSDDRENVIGQVKPLLLLRINEYCKREIQSCNIPTCWTNNSRVIFKRKQLNVEIANKVAKDRSKMTLRLMARLPGENEGIVPPDVLLEILNTAVSDIEQSCDVHVIRIWIGDTTDRLNSGLLKNDSARTSDGSRALTFIAVGACSVVAVVIVFGILFHQLRKIRSRRLKVNPLTDDDSTPPDSPDITIADKTYLLRKQDFDNMKPSSQLNEELELTSTTPGSIM